MAYNEAPNQQPSSPQEPSVPEPTVPQAATDASTGMDDGAQPQSGQPAQGWGAPQQGQPAQGWGAPQQGQPAGWGAPQQGQPAHGWGAVPPQGPRTSGSRLGRMTKTQKGLAAAAAAVVIAGGAGAAVYAATSSGAGTDATAGAGGQGGFGPGGQAGQSLQQGGQTGTRDGGFGGPGGLGVGMLGQVLHGEFVVLRDNQNVTMVQQSGTVTAVSGQSATVKSSDGFTQTYALTSNTEYAAGRTGRGQAGTGSQSGGGSQSGASSTTSLAQGQTVSLTALKDGLSALTVVISGTGN